MIAAAVRFQSAALNKIENSTMLVLTLSFRSCQQLSRSLPFTYGSVSLSTGFDDCWSDVKVCLRNHYQQSAVSGQRSAKDFKRDQQSVVSGQLRNKNLGDF
jgi:hypothetical protein